jgi:hypothetical protein
MGLSQALILLGDYRGGGHNVPDIVGQQEKAVGDLGRRRIGAHQDIHAELISPQSPHLHP